MFHPKSSPKYVLFHTKPSNCRFLSNATKYIIRLKFQCSDFTNNYLCSLPISLAHHGSIEDIHLLGNLFTSYPVILDTLQRLKSSDLLHLMFEENDNDLDNNENVVVQLLYLLFHI